MKILTVSEPFASLLVYGRSYGGEIAPKWCENRTWYHGFKGRLGIHAGKGSQCLSSGVLRRDFGNTCGHIIGTCEILGAVHTNWSLTRTYSTIEEMGWHPPGEECNSLRAACVLLRHKHFEGPWAWLYRDMVALPEPIPAAGKQGLWDFDL